MAGFITTLAASGQMARGPTVVLEVQYAPLVASASGATPVVAAVAGRQILVIAYSLIASGTVNVKWQSGSTDITGLKYLAPTTGTAGLVQGYNPAGWFITAAGEALNVNLSAAVAVGGEVVYVEVEA